MRVQLESNSVIVKIGEVLPQNSLVFTMLRWEPGSTLMWKIRHAKFRERGDSVALPSAAIAEAHIGTAESYKRIPKRCDAAELPRRVVDRVIFQSNKAPSLS